MRETANTCPNVYNDQMPRQRKRLQKGSLQKDGNWWRLRWYEDALDAEGKLVSVRRTSRVGPCKGPSAMSKKEAWQKAWDDVLVHVNAMMSTPASMMTVRQFVSQRFMPEVVFHMKPSGKMSYGWRVKVLLERIGDVRLCDLNVQTVQALLNGYIKDEYAIQTVYHFRNTVSAIVAHARRVGLYQKDNPASMVRLPDMERTKKPALTVEQARAALALLHEPIRTAALMSMSTSLNNAEVTGLRWMNLNLTNSPVLSGDLLIPPLSFAVVENWYKGQRGTVKTGARNRIQPIPEVLVEPLKNLYAAASLCQDLSDSPVFASSAGTPIDLHNVNARILKKIGKAIGVPALSWQSFRRTASTHLGRTDMAEADRIATMGHTSSAMSTYYSDSDIERRRHYVDELAAKLAEVAVPAGFAESVVENVKKIEASKDIDELKKLWEKE